MDLAQAFDDPLKLHSSRRFHKHRGSNWHQVCGFVDGCFHRGDVPNRGHASRPRRVRDPLRHLANGDETFDPELRHKCSNFSVPRFRLGAEFKHIAKNRDPIRGSEVR